MQLDIPNYTLLKKIGAGAFAEVWLAEHRNNRRRVAIKILKTSVEAGGDAEALFLREGEVLASFSERNIVTIFDNAKLGDTAYLIMELLPGGSLLDRMHQQGLEVGEAIGHIVQIAAALDAAHKRGIIHRDLKPANIMLRDETTPVLTDFGASKMLQRSTIYGKDGGVVGTPQYMSPEQITGQPLDGRSDLYALGVMFHELLTGRAPFVAATLHETLALHLHAPLPRLPAELAVLQPILERLLAKDREQRFRSGAELADALRRCFLDQEALRKLVRYPPSSAWSSQLRALGFQLDTAERSEVRIAQGEYLKQVQTAPMVALAQPAPQVLAAPPAPAPVAAAPVAAPEQKTIAPGQVATLWQLLLVISAGVVALTGLLAAGFALGGKDRIAESLLIAALWPLAAFNLAASCLARASRRWLLSGFCLLSLLMCLTALSIWQFQVLTGVRLDASWWFQLIPITVFASPLMGSLVLMQRLGRWRLVLAGLLTSGLCLGLAIAFEDEDQLWPVLLGIAVILNFVVWALLAIGQWFWPRMREDRPWNPPWPGAGHWRRRFLLAGALLLPLLLLPVIQHWVRQQQVHATVLGTWYGISAMGRVMVEFEAGGGLVVYGTGDGEQRPWIGRWTATAYDGYFALDLNTDEGQSLASTMVYGEQEELVIERRAYVDQFTPIVLPLVLQRITATGSPLVPEAGLRRKLDCAGGISFVLQLNVNGDGVLLPQQFPYPGAPEQHELRWLQLEGTYPGGLHFVLRHQTDGEKLRSGQLKPDQSSAELDFGSYPSTVCSVLAAP